MVSWDLESKRKHVDKLKDKLSDHERWFGELQSAHDEALVRADTLEKRLAATEESRGGLVKMLTEWTDQRNHKESQLQTSEQANQAMQQWIEELEEKLQTEIDQKAIEI